MNYKCIYIIKILINMKIKYFMKKLKKLKKITKNYSKFKIFFWKNFVFKKKHTHKYDSMSLACCLACSFNIFSCFLHVFYIFHVFNILYIIY